MPNLKLTYCNEKYEYVVWNQVNHGEFQATFYDEETALEFMMKFLERYVDAETVGKKG